MTLQQPVIDDDFQAWRENRENNFWKFREFFQSERKKVVSYREDYGAASSREEIDAWGLREIRSWRPRTRIGHTIGGCKGRDPSDYERTDRFWRRRNLEHRKHTVPLTLEMQTAIETIYREWFTDEAEQKLLAKDALQARQLPGPQDQLFVWIKSYVMKRGYAHCGFDADDLAHELIVTIAQRIANGGQALLPANDDLKLMRTWLASCFIRMMKDRAKHEHRQKYAKLVPVGDDSIFYDEDGVLRKDAITF